MQPDILQRFTTHLRSTLSRSIDLAWALRHPQISPGFLLYSLTHQDGSVGAEVLRNCSISADLVSEYISVEEGVNFDTSTVKESTDSVFLWPEFSGDAKQLIKRAALLALENRHQHIGTEHLLLALVDHPSVDWNNLMLSVDESLETLKQQLANVMASNTKYTAIQSLYSSGGSGQVTRTEQDGEVLTEQSSAEPETPSETPALDYFGVELTAAGEHAQLDPVIGRAEEIERLIHILSRRTKNNPVLIGEPGVGKTAIVEGLARRIVEGKVPDLLLHKRIIALDLSLMVAGTMYRGEFESRLKQLIDEVRSNPDVILFIDELHTLVGAGTVQGGSMDAANMLKPALAKGQIRCIGATTGDEYRKFIETDAALDRRFQSIYVAEPAEEEAVAILNGLKKYYESFHHVAFEDEALVAAVELAVRFLPEQRLPDKAIDLIDEAGAKGRVQRKVPAALKKLDALNRELAKLKRKKEVAVQAEQFQQAVDAKDQQTKTEKKLKRVREQVNKLKLPKTIITAHDIAQVIAKRTSIPLTHITAEPEKRFVNLAQELSARVIGQQEAVNAVTAVLKRSAAGLSSTERPLGSFLFLGPSGVGKTELAKVLAKVHFGDEQAVLRMDMAEFSEGFTVSKMVGAPAGYVGYNDGVKLADHIRRKPYSVVLFDEIEKAHPDIFNVLLQILDDGKLTEASGRELNFRHAVIVLTSNIGIDLLTRQAELGFDLGEKAAAGAEVPFDEIRQRVLEDLQASFPPEFLSRIDHHIVFKPLSKKTLLQVVDLQFAAIADRLKDKGISVRLLASAKKLVVQKSFSPEQGARLIRKMLSTMVEDVLADRILSGKIRSGDAVKIVGEKDRLVVKKERKR